MKPVMRTVDAINEIPEYLGVNYNNMKDKVVSAAGMGAAGLSLAAKKVRGDKFERNMRELLFREKAREFYADAVVESTNTLRHVEDKLHANTVFVEDLKREITKFLGSLITYNEL